MSLTTQHLTNILNGYKYNKNQVTLIKKRIRDTTQFHLQKKRLYEDIN